MKEQMYIDREKESKREIYGIYPSKSQDITELLTTFQQKGIKQK